MFETYTLSNDINIYPLIKYIYNNKEYLFYTENQNLPLKFSDIIVAEVIDNNLLSVDEDILKEFDTLINNIINIKLKEYDYANNSKS